METILVTGATGQQGGSAMQHLLAEGFRVRALVRQSTSAAALRLVRAGAALAVGDMDDRGSLDAAVRGVYGVFSVQPALIPPHFAENELGRGLNVADAARAAGVKHLVYASVASADRKTGIPHWEIKWQVEQHIRKRGLPFTVLRPTMFMENHADRTYGVTGDHSLVRTIPPNELVQHIALNDIGAFAAIAFRNPEYYLGKAIELAGDELTVEQITMAISRALRRPLPPREAVRSPSPDVGHGAKGAEHVARFAGWPADIPALRKLYPRLMNFDSWLAQDGAAMIERLLNYSDTIQ